jgi:hypothetical protein
VSFSERELIPPAPVGEPYRGDPGQPPPFEFESPRDARAERQQFQHPMPPPQLPAHVPLTPEQRFARIALWVGVASIFVFNLVLGPVAIVLGILAIRRGELQTGRRAALFGLLGTVIGAIFMYLVANGMLPSVEEMLKDLETKR